MLKHFNPFFKQSFVISPHFINLTLAIISGHNVICNRLMELMRHESDLWVRQIDIFIAQDESKQNCQNESPQTTFLDRTYLTSVSTPDEYSIREVLQYGPKPLIHSNNLSLKIFPEYDTKHLLYKVTFLLTGKCLNMAKSTIQ